MTTWRSRDPNILVTSTPLYKKILDAVDRATAVDPNYAAFISAETSTVTTFKQIGDWSKRMATFLLHRGVKPQDIVHGFLYNCPEYVSLFVGANMVGAWTSTLTALAPAPELQRALLDNKAVVVMTDDELLPLTLKAVVGTCVKTVICYQRPDHTKPLPEGVFDYKDVLAMEPLDPANAKAVDDPEETSVILFSSGTTGPAKPMMLHNRAVSCMMDFMCYYSRMWDEVIPRHGNYTLVQQAMYHAYGFLMSFRALFNLEIAVLMRKFDAIVFLNTIQNFKISTIYVVPPLVLMLVKSPLAAKYDLSSIKMAVSSSAPLGHELSQAFINKYKGLILVQAYASTEMGVPCCMPDVRTPKSDLDTVGYVASNFEVRILDVATRAVLGPNQEGEVAVRTPTLFKGYLNRPAETAALYHDGWMLTGDLAKMREDGKLVYLDRLKELIKVNGLSVCPAQIEDILVKHPLIADAAVIKVLDPETFERPYAFVVRRSEALTAQEVIKYVAENLATYKQIKECEFIERIPRGPTGKILRSALQKMVNNRRSGAQSG